MQGTSCIHMFVLKRKKSWCQETVCKLAVLIFTCCSAHCILAIKYKIIWMAVIAVKVTVINK